MPDPPESTPVVVDATDLVLGRAASLIAKRLLRGESVVVVHAEKAVLTGARERVLGAYRAARARGSPRSGPHFPRYADRIFRRTVRGMLPYKKGHGRAAFRRLRVFAGVPPEFSAVARVPLEEARASPSLRPPITLGEVSRRLGAKE